MELRKLISTVTKFLVIFLLVYCFKVKGLSIIKFSVPELVPEGSTTQFQCLYDLGHDKLYSLKWYWNESEFYRYEPTSQQKRIQAFKVPPFTVDEPRSSKIGTNVIVRDLKVDENGIIKCEISADISFLTVRKEKMMTIASDAAHLAGNKLWTIGLLIPLLSHVIIFSFRWKSFFFG